jgi:RecA/RadA recombinase
MIIEIYGPPGAGKTTFARQLAAQSREGGGQVKLILSVRPAETNEGADTDSVPRARWALMRRLTRPAIELLTCTARDGLRSNGIASELLGLLPPVSATWRMRLRQYIARLESSWRLAEQANGTVILDQGFVQVVGSLVLLARAPTPSAIDRALALIPKADQWIRVDAPRELLRARLEARRRAQGWIERRLEFDVETSLRSIAVLDTLEMILQRDHARIVRVAAGQSWGPSVKMAEPGVAMSQAG